MVFHQLVYVRMGRMSVQLLSGDYGDYFLTQVAYVFQATYCPIGN